MTKFKLGVFLGVVILFAHSSIAFSEVRTPSSTVEASSIITAIEIRGNHIISKEKILDAVFSRVGDVLLEEKVRADVKGIQAMGYFSDTGVSFRAYAGGTKIIFNVLENPIVSNITIEGNTVYSEELILSKINTKPNQILNFNTLQDDIKTINDLYRNDGYTLARIVDVGEEGGKLKIKIVEGTIEKITLEGNEATRDYVILREMKTKPGMALNEKMLSKDLRAVFNLGFFSEISPQFEPGSTRDKIILVVKMKETRTNTINFGGGYSESQGGFGFMDLSINNLLGTAQAMLIRGQVGAFPPTYQFKYYNPWIYPELTGDHTSATLRLWSTAGQYIYGLETPQTEKRVGWDIAFGKPFREVFRGSVSFGNEVVEPISGATFDAYSSDTVQLSVSYDTRDYWQDPHEGFFHTLSLRQGWTHFLGKPVFTQFTKLGLDLEQFIPLAEHQTLALHLGTGIGFGDVPIGELYWAGGANTVRGYWPASARTGTRKLIGNIEYRYTFNEFFQAVVFYDYGNAWSAGAPDFGSFLAGYGFGIRLNTPLGPIRLDYGIGLGKSFGEGTLHFSIGHAF